MEKDDKTLLAMARDRLRQAEKRNKFTNTAFLSPARQEFLRNALKDASFCFEGGFESAERKVMIFFPEGENASPAGDDSPLRLLRLKSPGGPAGLSHRDYLGALLALGVDRSVSGDIIVCEDGADMAVLKEVGEYLAQNYVRAGNVNMQACLLPIEKMRSDRIKRETVRDTVASLRLDSLVASFFRISRNKAKAAVNMGLVQVNGRQLSKADFIISEGDAVSLRGKGKAVLVSIGGKSRKERDCIVFERYL